MRDQLVQVLIARKVAQDRLAHQRAGRRNELVMRHATELHKAGIDPADALIGVPEISGALQVPASTVRRWISKNYWGLGESSVRLGGTGPIAMAAHRVQDVRTVMEGAAASRKVPPPARKRRPLRARPMILSALRLAEVQLTTTDLRRTYRAIPSWVLSATLRAMVRDGLLEREKVDSRAATGPRLVWGYRVAPPKAGGRVDDRKREMRRRVSGGAK